VGFRKGPPNQPEPALNLPQNFATILRDHVALALEAIDRMYLNVYMPLLQTDFGVVRFFKKHRGALFASSALMDPITNAFIATIDKFVKKQNIPVVKFAKGQRKDDVAKEHLARFQEREGVLFLGKAQEKAPVFRTEKRTHPETGKTYPWIVKSTAMVMYYYFYCVDEDFGPFFLKYCSYFPYNAKLCINGHEYLKRQLDKEGIAYEALDNGILSCENPKRMQEIANSLSAEKICDLAHKWQTYLPYPYTDADTSAGYQYAVSILQAEFSLTQVLDRPVTGRLFFEQVIGENLDIGRPDQVQLIFERRVTKRTPGRFRTRVITEGVTPSLHVDYKRARIKQYHKEGRALRTETTINDTRDFGVNRGILNLPKLRQIGFQANRRLLDVQRISHDCALGEDAFQRLQRPATKDNQRTSAMRFADNTVQALLAAMVMFRMQPSGFSNRDLRKPFGELLGAQAGAITQGRMTYNLRRLKLHGLITRTPRSHRYRLTEFGLKVALLYCRLHARVLRPAVTAIVDLTSNPSNNSRGELAQLQRAIERCCRQAYLAA
jgi:DNA-binding PadR family transcriptional regulator